MLAVRAVSFYALTTIVPSLNIAHSQPRKSCMSTNVTRVGIAVVCQDSQLVVGWRTAPQVLADQAEFPGGKCLPEETFTDCVIRECLEETGLSVVPNERLLVTRHEYPHGLLDLEFWACGLAANDKLVDGQLPALQGNFRWMPVSQVAELPFPAANQPVVSLLVARNSAKVPPPQPPRKDSSEKPPLI